MPIVRFATFNVSLSSDDPNQLRDWLSHPNHPRLKNLAAILQDVRPDVVLLCEFDHPSSGGDDGRVGAFLTQYLGVSQHGLSPLHYPYTYCPSSNTGVLPPSNQSLSDETQSAVRPVDALGFGYHEGQYGFVLLSKYQMDLSKIRSWQRLLWKDFPNNQMPKDYYSVTAQGELPLSSKNHLAVPILIDDQWVSVLACHPTPPVFDGEEKRNWKRNSDELRLWQHLLDGKPLMDDQGSDAPLPTDLKFVLMGDLNADPIEGDGDKIAIRQLLHHPKMAREVSHGRLSPSSKGALEHRVYRPRQRRNAKHWTHLSGLRLDHVLPSKDLKPLASGVYWPPLSDPKSQYLLDAQQKTSANGSSDHRLVWVDVQV